MSGTKSSSTKAATLAHVQALIAGTQKHFPNGSFMLGKAQFTTATLVTLFQSMADAIVALSNAHASVKAAVLALKANEAQVGPVLRAYVSYVRSALGNAAQDLVDFGLEPPKVRAPLDSEKRAAATAKLRATRSARGTLGKRKRLSVKGDVTGVNITPVTGNPPAAPPAPQPPPQK
jgi:hypothetical protein